MAAPTDSAPQRTDGTEAVEKSSPDSVAKVPYWKRHYDSTPIYHAKFKRGEWKLERTIRMRKRIKELVLVGTITKHDLYQLIYDEFGFTYSTIRRNVKEVVLRLMSE